MGSDQAEGVISRLLKNPELLSRVERILDISENVDGRCNTADEAEERAVKELRQLGNELLQSWAEKRKIDHESSVPEATYSKKTKKNSIGEVAGER